MRIIVNGEEKDVDGPGLGDVLRQCGYDNEHVATALNGEFVHRHLREDTRIRPGDRIEVVSPIAGG